MTTSEGKLKSAFAQGLLKVVIAVLGVGGVGVIVLHERLDTQFDDKLYPVLLIASIVLWHWLAWRLFWDLLRVPETKRLDANRRAVAKKSGLSWLILLGYVFLVLSIFNFYASPEFAHAAKGVRYSLIAISVGLLGQMMAVVRHLIAENAPAEVSAQAATPSSRLRLP